MTSNDEDYIRNQDGRMQFGQMQRQITSALNRRNNWSLPRPRLATNFLPEAHPFPDSRAS